MGRKKYFIIFFCFLLASCGSRMNYDQAMSIKLTRLVPYADKNMRPYFLNNNVPYPPKALAFLIFKNTRKFEIWARGSNRWVYIRTMPIFGASGGLGPKLRAGDHQVPEGIYGITALNPLSRFDLSMALSYPNKYDRNRARLEGRRDLGGEIYIHGTNLSAGCIAMGNMGIEQLFPLVYEVGIRHVAVIIAPNDLRIQKPLYQRNHPRWLSDLYRQIAGALKVYAKSTNVSAQNNHITIYPQRAAFAS